MHTRVPRILRNVFRTLLPAQETLPHAILSHWSRFERIRLRLTHFYSELKFVWEKSQKRMEKNIASAFRHLVALYMTKHQCEILVGNSMPNKFVLLTDF